MEAWVKEFGDPFLLNALNGPVVVTGREDLIRTVYGQSPDVFEPFAVATLAPLMGNGSMFVLDGEAHRRERRLVMPLFHGDRMKAYGLAMQETVTEQLKNRDLDKPLRTKKLMIDISLEIIVRTVFGGDNREMAQLMVDASHRMVAAASPLLFFSRKTHVSFLGFTPWDRWSRAKRELFMLFDQAIEEHKRVGTKREDILSLLCDANYEDGQPITREHIHAELMTFLFAGHETTALTLTWAIYHLHRCRQQLLRLREELDALPDLQPSTLATAPYLKAVVQETLRIHPIVTETLRKLRAPVVLGDFTIPAGVAIAPATVLAHHNPQTYVDPDVFQPERFLGRSYSPFEYMPFGGGHRRCIGAAFAGYEMAIVLGTLLKRYEFELQESQEVVPKRRSVTMGPSSDVPVFAKIRC
jgi:cytochrome P450